MDGSTTPPPPTVDTAARKHVPPSWAGEPKSDYSLEVIKDGTSIQVLPINERDHYIIGTWLSRLLGGLHGHACCGFPAGRQPDVCEILLDHPSISRQHAALQFNDKGMLAVLRRCHEPVRRASTCSGSWPPSLRNLFMIFAFLHDVMCLFCLTFVCNSLQAASRSKAFACIVVLCRWCVFTACASMLDE